MAGVRGATGSVAGRRWGTVIGVLFALFCGVGAACDLEGTVLDGEGKPVAGARVRIVGQSAETRTDSVGGFHLSAPVCPVLLEVGSVGYVATRLRVSAQPERPLEVTLVQSVPLREEITVTERSVGVGRVPPGAAVAAVAARGGDFPVSSAAELATAVPGVALNGQGGRSQGPSIRGISRHRILTSLAGVRVTGERRAGVSADFLDPLLIDRIGVIRGPSSGYRGSGALGGVIEILPREFTNWQGHSEYRNQGSETALAGGWGDGTLSLGLAGRGAGNAATPSGDPINSHFRSFSSVVGGRWDRGDREYRFSVISSVGTDIGKAANDYPQKSTTYPLERHLLAQFGSNSAQGWEYAAGVHGQTLHTEAREDGAISDVYTDSWDLDMRASHRISLHRTWRGEIGVDYFGRRSVDSRERESAGEPLLRALDGGLEDNVGLFASIGHEFSWARVEGGGRLSLLRQRNGGYDAVTGSSGDGFLGLVVPMREGLDLNLALGTGLRYPSLSERFYSGLTGRGRIIGEPSLERERSRGYEAGLLWSRPRFFVASRLFGTRIDRYIERIELTPDLYSYANLTRGTIRGLEFEAVASPFEQWFVSFRGHTMSGRSGVEPLADIPVDRLTLGLSHRGPRWEGGLVSQLRGSKRDPGSGERPVDGVVLWTPFILWRAENGVEFSLSVANLTNRTFLETADKKTAYAPGRAFVIGLSWMPLD